MSCECCLPRIDLIKLKVYVVEYEYSPPDIGWSSAVTRKDQPSVKVSRYNTLPFRLYASTLTLQDKSYPTLTTIVTSSPGVLVTATSSPGSLVLLRRLPPTLPRKAPGPPQQRACVPTTYKQTNIPFTSHWISPRYIVHWI